MKILSILPTFKDENSYNWRANIGFINKLSILCEYHGIKSYNKDSIIHPAKYLYNKYNPDVMILLTHSNLLDGYLYDIPCLKVMISVDFRKIMDREMFYWYKNNKFDLVIQRGAYNVEVFNKNIGMPCVWVPYSTDEKVFYPKKWESSKIGFAGTTGSYYVQRNKAIKLLERENLIDNGGKIIGLKYISFLQSHRGMLTSTAVLNERRRSPHAKMFEIIASGSVLLSPGFDYEEHILSSYIQYKDDCSDIVEKAKWIINNEQECIDISNKAHEEFLEKHTDIIRIKELYEYIKSMIEGRELIKKWSI